MREAARATWEELSEDASAGAVALVPVGSTEAHGPHLPLDTDVLIAREVARRAGLELEARGQRAVLFPPLAYGVTDFAAGFAGTVSLRASTVEALAEDLCRSIAGQGFSKVVLVNHHLEPAHFAALHAGAAAAGVPAIVPDHRKKPWALGLGEEFCRGGSHAGRYETSLVLAAAAAEVRASRAGLARLDVDLGKAIKGGARSFVELGADRAYLGEPAAATAEEGDALYAHLARHVVALVLGDPAP